MLRYLSTLILGAALLAPVAALADDHDRRYYDRDRRDYHVWNSGENEAYRRYLAEKRLENREFARLSRRRQSDYWRWRHEHEEHEHR